MDPNGGRSGATGAARQTRSAGLTGLTVLAALVALIWVGYVIRVAHFDVDVFLRAGAAVADGRDPYPPPGTPEVYSGFAFVYPYLMALPFAPLSWLPAADEVFIALSAAAVLAGCRLAGARHWRTCALVLVASFTITGLQMGTLNALLFCGLVAMWRLRDAPVPAGALGALLVYSKLFLVPVLLWLVLTRRLRAAAMAAAALAVLFVVGELVSPVGAETYVDMLSALAREEAPDGVSLTGLLMNTGLGLDAATWGARAAGAAIVVGCAVSVRRRIHSRTHDRTHDQTHDGPASADRLLFAATVAAAIVASPIVWSHYLLLLAAPLLVISVGADSADGSRPGRGLAGGGSDAPVALFALGSWLLVTPHLSDPVDLAAAAAVLAALAGPPLLRAARGRVAPGRVAAVAGASALTAGVGATVWLAARAYGDDSRVIGAYGALVGILALLIWATASTRRGPDERTRSVGLRPRTGGFRLMNET